MLRRVKARSRCEVGGKVYLPGDDFLATPAQIDYLKAHDAVDQIPMLHVTTGVQPGMTVEQADEMYQTITGGPRPKKEKVK